MTACQTVEPAAPPTTIPVAAVAETPHAAVATIERSRRDSNRDDILQSLVSRKIKELDRTAFRGVTVDVWGGRVLLMGAVIKPENRRHAEQQAASVSGVRRVTNELILAEDRALDLFVPNTAKEEQVRRELGIEGKAGLTVHVINNVAFLLGGAADPTQAEALRNDAGEIDGIKWVVAHLDGAQ
nr:BON domain-containing protein [Magnetospirillum sulfuroxidans]